MAPYSQGSSPEALIARLAAARSILGEEAKRARQKLDVPARVRQSLLNKPLAWLGGSIGAGLLISILFRRKRRSAPVEAAKKKRGILGFLLGSAFSLARPAIEAWALKELRNRIAPPAKDSWRND